MGRKTLFAFALTSMMFLGTIGCGGGGGGSTTPPVTPPTAGLALYVADIGSGTVAASVNIFDSADTANGASAWDRQLAGSSTTLSNTGRRPEGMAYDNVRNYLYVTGEWPLTDNGAVLVFSSAATANGNVAPAKIIQGTSPKLVSPFDIFYDRSNDRLYVADFGLGQILVYDNASTLTNTSNPNRIFSGGTDIDNTTRAPISISVDVTRDILYVVTMLGDSVLVFDGASTYNGDKAADRKIGISGAKFGDVKLDAANNVAYCIDLIGTGRVYAVASASTATGTVSASRTVQLSLGANEEPMVSFLDLNSNRLFVSVADTVLNTGKVLVFNGLSTLNGSPAPSRTLTGFAFPTGMAGFYR